MDYPGETLLETDDELRSRMSKQQDHVQPELPKDSEAGDSEDLAYPDELKQKRREAKEALRPELPAGDPTDAPQP